MAVPYTFGTATAAIPLSNLDSNFATTITLGNTAIQLGNTVTTLNNMTLANVTVSSGNLTLTNVSATLANVTTANIGTAVITGTSTLTGLTASTALALDASKNIVSVTNTGTGNNVLATSPTLVTPVLGAASATSVTVAAGAVGTPSITTTSDTNTGIFFPAADTIAFSEGGTESMRIDSSGRLLINKTSNNGTSLVQMTSPASTDIILAQIGTNGGSAMAFLNSGGAAQVGSIVVNVATTAYNTISDYRLKEFIAPMTGALAKVALLKPVTYKWKINGSDGEGFIAHELDEVVPGCVTGEKDAVDADGNPKYQGIDTSFLVATLTAAIQEQQALITSLTARITALEAK